MHRWLILLVLGLSISTALGCGQATKPVEAKAESQPAAAAGSGAVSEENELIIPIQADHPKRGDISSHFETTTRVDAESRVQVVTEGAGECIKVNAEEGDRVKQGAILAELDRTEAQATVGQTEVQVRQSKTALEIAEKSLAEGIVSKAERDNSQFAYEQAAAALNMQKVKIEKLTIKSPINGIVTRKTLMAGQIVAPGTPVFSIVDPASFILTIFPPEKELPRLKVGQVAKVTIDALGKDEYNATVRRVNPGVDPLSGTVKVTLDFEEAVREKLREAAFARVQLVMETHENALLLSKDTIVEENARKYVFIIVPRDEAEAGKPVEGKPAAAAPPPDAKGKEKPLYVANRVEVQTGLEDSDFAEILSGVEDKSLVVTLGQHTLKSGAHVVITNADDEISSKVGLSAEEALKVAQEKRAGVTQKFGESRHRGPRAH